MPRSNKLFQIVAVGALVLGPALSHPAPAQEAPPPPAGAPEAQIEVNPPERVGAVARLSGSVSYHTAQQDQWSEAALNYPVSTGDGFWTQPGAEADLAISSSRVALAALTELDVDRLDQQEFVATLPQGETYLRVRNLLPGESYTVVTPRGSVTIATPGRYEIVAGTTATPTLVTVLEGAATIGDTISLQVPPGQTAEINGETGAFTGQLVSLTRDPFLDGMLARERPVVAQAAAPPPIVEQMPGSYDLAQYGSWTPAPDYGPVWYPQVAPGWTPYSVGHWAYVAPWGWTWVDAEPWGFAPFHYGRWAEIGGRWGWIPGINSGVVVGAPIQPVYAPALVAFFGLGAQVGVGFNAGFGGGFGGYGGRVGWVPLGPGEVYRPWFHASPTYVRNVNIRQVTNVTRITNVNTTVNNITINQFRNARAATVIPATAMAVSRPVQQVAQRVPVQSLAQIHPVVGHAPIPPSTATLGVTPRIAQQIHAAPPPAGVVVPARPHAPGPVIRAQAPAVASAPGKLAPVRPGETRREVAMPALHGNPPAGRPGEPVHPATPALTQHGTQPVQAGVTPQLAHPGTKPVPELRTPEAGRAGPPPVHAHEQLAVPGQEVRKGVEAQHASPAVAAPQNEHPAEAGQHEAAPQRLAEPTPHVAEPTPHAAPAQQFRAPVPAQRYAAPVPRYVPPAPRPAPHPVPQNQQQQQPHAAHTPTAQPQHAALPAPQPHQQPPALHAAAPAQHMAQAPTPHAPPPPAPHTAPPAAPHPAPPAMQAHAASPPPHPAPAGHPQQDRRPGQPG